MTRRRAKSTRCTTLRHEFAGCVLVFVLLLSSCAGADRGNLVEPRSVDSGDGWTLLDSGVDPAHIPGSVERFDSPGGVGLRFVVATSSGGETDCGPPRLVGSTRTGSTLTFDLMWQQRGCADAVGEAFDVAVQDIPDGGLVIAFPITPEQGCEGAVLYPDGSVVSCLSGPPHQP